MGLRREDLSDDERKEYDDLLIEAGLDENGLERPSGEIGDRMHQLLLAADSAGRRWAEWILVDDAEVGHLQRFKGWHKARERVHVYDKTLGAIVPKTAVVSVRRKREDGSRYYQMSIYALLTRAEAEQKLEEALSQRRSAAVNVMAARRLLELWDAVPDAVTAADAAAALNTTVEDWLAESRAS